jgi:hypothetical protein
MKILANMLTSEGKQVQIARNSSLTGPWPLYTMPDFEAVASYARDMSGALILAVVPHVPAHFRSKWEKYSVNNQDWVGYGHDFLEKDGNPHEGLRITPFIFRKDDYLSYYPEREVDNLHNVSGHPFAPLWQISPPPHDAGIVNYNFYQHLPFRSLASRIIETGGSGISEVQDLVPYFGLEALEEVNYNNEPQSLAIVPIFGTFKPDEDLNEFNGLEGDDFNPETQFMDEDGNVVVAFLVAVVPWGRFFANVLNEKDETKEVAGSLAESEQKRGTVDVVLRQSAGCSFNRSTEESFSFRINGPKALYLGNGDFHDPKYNYMVTSSDFALWEGVELANQREHKREQGDKEETHDDHGHDGEEETHDDHGHGDHRNLFEDDDVDHDVEEDHDGYGHCNYSIDIYPTSDYETNYKTNEPILFTCLVLGAFLFTTVVFCLYDFFVARRQKKVRGQAVRSNAIVSSLFPAQVRDKLYATEDEQRKQYKSGLTSITAAAKMNFTVNDNTPFLGSPPSGPAADWQQISNQSAPIADLFRSATVVFADIAGFTSWSSQREPSQVFILLETIYHSFDRIATRRKVFKVETIGDCYVSTYKTDLYSKLLLDLSFSHLT